MTMTTSEARTLPAGTGKIPFGLRNMTYAVMNSCTRFQGSTGRLRLRMTGVGTRKTDGTRFHTADPSIRRSV